MASDLETLPTPCALVEKTVVEANARAMAEKATSLGVRLRPHVKTHKCIEGARLQTAGHFGGITVSTLAEARHFAAKGFQDVTYAVPLAPQRAAEAVALAQRLDVLHLLVDSLEASRALEAAAAQAGQCQSVLLKVDCGYHRAGVDPQTEEARDLARFLASSPHLAFRGLLAHGGHSYDCRNRDEILKVAQQERRVTVAFADSLRREGLEVREVSIGSTPTLAVAESLAEGLTGVTEVRPGNYLFFDLFQAAIGSCRREDLALTVLTTVIGCHPQRGTLLLDAGALALSKDPGAVHVDPEVRYGLLTDPAGGEVLDDLHLVSLSQEHGKVRCTPEAARRHPVGSRLRILPNHACMVAAHHDRLHVVDGGDVVEVWRPMRGW